MNKLLLFAGLGLLTLTSQAQQYSISPSHTIYVNAPYENFSIFDIYQHNITNNSIILEWELISNDLVSGWDFSLCDFGACYAGIPPAGRMDTVYAGGEGFLGLNIDPRTIPGTGTVRIYVYEASQPDDGDTLTWVVTAGPDGVGTGMSPGISVYPNPATDIVNIDLRQAVTPIVSISLLNMLGQQVAGKAVENKIEQLDISNLPEGTYLLLLTDEKGEGHPSALIK